MKEFIKLLTWVMVIAVLVESWMAFVAWSNGDVAIAILFAFVGVCMGVMAIFNFRALKRM